MTNRCETISQLKSVIEYIIWNYSENVTDIEDKAPVVIVKDCIIAHEVTVFYIGEIKKGNGETDPAISTDDRPLFTSIQFTVLDNISFSRLTEFVEDACEKISNVKLDV